MEKDNDPIPQPSVNLSKEDADGCIVAAITIFSDIVKNEMANRRVKTEDELDLHAYYKAIEDYQKNPVTYSLDEVEAELGLK